MIATALAAAPQGQLKLKALRGEVHQVVLRQVGGKVGKSEVGRLVEECIAASSKFVVSGKVVSLRAKKK